MNATTIDKIKIKEFANDINILDFEMESRANKHGKARVKALVINERIVNEVKEILDKDIITIVESGESERILFAGYANDLEVLDDGYKGYIVNIELISASILLDIEKRKKSFQDINMTYEELLKNVVSSTKNSVVNCNIGADETIGSPLIQYDETNWEFIKRVASHFNASIVPELEYGLPRVMFGIEDGQVVDMKMNDYSTGISNKYYELDGVEEGLDRDDFIYYKVKSYDNYSIGDSVSVDGEKLSILEKGVETIRGELIFLYKIGKNILMGKKKYSNKSIIGASIFGEVLKRDGELLKLHLDIDKSQAVSKAYNFPWSPKTKNMMYCMPNIGEKVALYFGDSEEESGVVINCVRENGASGGEFSDYNNRYLTTEFNKQIKLTPKDMDIIQDIANINSSRIKILDDTKIEIRSKGGLEVIASGKIKIDSKVVNFKVPIRLTFKQGNNSVDFNNDIHVIAESAVAICTEYDSYPIIQDAPVIMAFDKKGFFSKLLGCLAVIAVATVVAVAVIGTAGLAGPIIFGAAIGASVAVCVQAAEDYSSGNVSSWETYIRKAVVGGINGAVTGAMSYFKVIGTTSKLLQVLSKSPGITGNLTGTTVEWAWTSLTKTDKVDAMDFVASIISGGLGDLAGDLLGKVRIPINGKPFAITADGRLALLFSGGKGAAKNGIKKLAQSLGMTTKEFYKKLGYNSINELKHAIKATSTSKANIDILKKGVPDLLKKILLIQAIEGKIIEFPVNDGTDKGLDFSKELLGGELDNIKPGSKEFVEALKRIFDERKLINNY